MTGRIGGIIEMTRNRSETVLPDADLRRAANALRKAGNTREAKRLERNLPASTKRGKDKS